MNIGDRLLEIEAGFAGKIGLAAKHLGSGRTILWHADAKRPTASVIKLPVLVHALMLAHDGRISLDDRVTLDEADKKPGSGVLTHLSDGLTISLRDACMLMIALSDNTATNLVLDRVTIEGVNERMACLGLRDTRIFRKVYSDGPPVCAENARYGLGVTTARDMMRLLALIHGGVVGGAPVGVEARRYLAAQMYRDGIPRMLPAEWTYEGKTGAVDAVRNDVGLLTGPGGDVIAVAVLCSNMPTPLWTADNPGLLTIARLARLVVECLASAGA